MDVGWEVHELAVCLVRSLEIEHQTFVWKAPKQPRGHPARGDLVAKAMEEHRVRWPMCSTCELIEEGYERLRPTEPVDPHEHVYRCQDCGEMPEGNEGQEAQRV